MTSHRVLVAAAIIAALILAMSVATWADSPAEEIAALLGQGRVPAAAEVAVAWAAAEPGNTEALHAAGALAFEVGQYQQAEEAYRSLLFYAPNDIDLLLKLGRVLLGRGLHAEAREVFESAINLGNSREAYVELARVALLDSEDPGDMLSASEVALSVAPDYGPAHAVMGAALRALGRYQQAIAAFERARELDPDDHLTLYELGLTLELVGDELSARRAWESFAKAAPLAPQAWLLANGLVGTRVEPIIDRVFDASYSPDGARIAFRSRGPGGWCVFTTPADGPPVENRIWAADSDDTIASLVWSPASSSIAVLTSVRVTDDEGRSQLTRRLIVVPSDGGEPRMVAEGRQLGEISWNPGNGRIAMRNHERGQGWHILEVDPDTGEDSVIAVGERRLPHYSPTWSSDGAKMAAVRRTAQLPDGSFAFELLVGPADDFTEATPIYRTNTQLRALSFSPDGSVILFALPGPVSPRLNVWAMPADGSREPVLVDHMTGQNAIPGMSPDGRYLLTSRDLTLVRITLVGLSGG